MLSTKSKTLCFLVVTLFFFGATRGVYWLKNKYGSKGKPQDSEIHLSVDAFASEIKIKYPEYNDLDNKELVDLVIKKYPEYKELLHLVDTKPPLQVDFFPDNIDEIINGTDLDYLQVRSLQREQPVDPPSTISRKTKTLCGVTALIAASVLLIFFFFMRARLVALAKFLKLKFLQVLPVISFLYIVVAVSGLGINHAFFGESKTIAMFLVRFVFYLCLFYTSKISFYFFRK